MIRINIIGTGFIDMPEGGGISFKRENHYFRFCDISLARSVEFTIPATRHNRTLLGYGDDPAFYGDMLRDKHPVQIVHDIGVLRGTLSVTGYEGDAFKCVILLGEMPWLSIIQDKKLSDLVTSWQKGIIWADANVIDANDPNVYVFISGVGGVKLLRYDDGINGHLLPSINVKAFIQDILTEAGVPHNIDVPKEYWLVMNTLRGNATEAITMTSTGTNNLTITGGSSMLQVVTVDIEWASNSIFGAYVGGGSTTIKAFKALQDVELTFPTPFPNDCYLVSYATKIANYNTLGGMDSYGNPDPHGGEEIGSLAGKTVTLRKGAEYFFAPNPWMVDWAYPGGYVGYKDTFHPFTFSFTVARSTNITQGEAWYIANNMPEMTAFEFIKSAALAAGCEVVVDETGVVVQPATYGGTFRHCRNIVSVDSVTRRVDAWGSGTQQAVVCFDSEDYVTQPIRWGYYIDNDQLTEAKEFKAKFSEGSVGNSGILIHDVDASDPPKILAKKPTIAYANSGLTTLQRIPDVSMVGCEDIAGDSTCVRMKMRVGNAEFFTLTPRDVWVWRGMAYVWTDADWSDGVLSLTLQKVSQARPVAP